MTARALALAALTLACSSGDSQPTPAPAPPPAPPPASHHPQPDRAPAPPDAAPEPPPDCDAYHRGLAGQVGRTLRAAAARDVYDQAVATLEAGHPACRDGRWYVAAARLLRYQKTAIAGLDSPRAALKKGLAAPPSRELYMVVAFLAPLGSSPELPADACAVVRAAPPVPGPAYESDDRAAYVCGHAALAAGDYDGAATELASITMQARYPDLALRRAQAAYCKGKRSYSLEKAARKLDPTVSSAFGASDREHQLLREAASSGELRRLDCRTTKR